MTQSTNAIIDKHWCAYQTTMRRSRSLAILIEEVECFIVYITGKGFQKQEFSRIKLNLIFAEQNQG